MSADALQPGDVVVVRTPLTIPGLAIRCDALLHHEQPVDHVAVVHHRDPNGRIVVSEGRPSRIGLANLDDYVAVSDNAGQTKTDAQRAGMVADMDAARGTSYDWLAILVDVGAVLGLPEPTAADYGARLPRQLVCSSYAVWLYHRQGLPHPAGMDRWVRPYHWQRFNRRQDWRATTTAGETP